MNKVSWIYIPISIIGTIIFLSLIVYLIIRIYINKFKSEISSTMITLCKNDQKDYLIPNIENFENLNYHAKNSYAFFILNSAVSAWSGCQKSLPNIDTFSNIGKYQSYDSYDDVYRNTSTMYYSKVKNIIIISFSGTRYLSEWYDDFDYEQIKPDFINDNKILIHRGHYKLYATLRNKLMNDLKNILNDQTVIVCTGHSLGASLATICFADMFSNKISKNITLYSYGSPRVGNNSFVNLVNGKGTSYRIVNNEDLIPQLILSIMIKGQDKYYYEHIDKTISFSINLEDYQKNHIEAYEKYLKN